MQPSPFKSVMRIPSAMECGTGRKQARARDSASAASGIGSWQRGTGSSASPASKDSMIERGGGKPYIDCVKNAYRVLMTRLGLPEM